MRSCTRRTRIPTSTRTTSWWPGWRRSPTVRVTNSWSLNDSLIDDRDPGTFFPEHILYYFTADLDPDREYRVVADVRGERVEAVTPLVNDFSVNTADANPATKDRPEAFLRLHQLGTELDHRPRWQTLRDLLPVQLCRSAGYGHHLPVLYAPDGYPGQFRDQRQRAHERHHPGRGISTSGWPTSCSRTRPWTSGSSTTWTSSGRWPATSSIPTSRFRALDRDRGGTSGLHQPDQRVRPGRQPLSEAGDREAALGRIALELVQGQYTGNPAVLQLLQLGSPAGCN